MIRIGTKYRYDFYVSESPTPLLNIVPSGSKLPEGGYASREYISKIKGFSEEVWLELEQHISKT
jgi:hypothetical protein